MIKTALLSAVELDWVLHVISSTFKDGHVSHFPTELRNLFLPEVCVLNSRLCLLLRLLHNIFLQSVPFPYASCLAFSSMMGSLAYDSIS